MTRLAVALVLLVLALPEDVHGADRWTERLAHDASGKRWAPVVRQAVVIPRCGATRVAVEGPRAQVVRLDVVLGSRSDLRLAVDEPGGTRVVVFDDRGRRLAMAARLRTALTVTSARSRALRLYLPRPRGAPRVTVHLAERCVPIASALDLNAGIDRGGLALPRAGVENDTLRRTLGHDEEPFGKIETLGGKTFVSGKVSWFGGPEDKSIGPKETGALAGERLREMAHGDDARERPHWFWYAAMRFDSRGHRKAWANARLLVVNPKNGRAVVVRPNDWGPHTRTGRILDLSRPARGALLAQTDDTVRVAFAPEDTPRGPVRTRRHRASAAQRDERGLETQHRRSRSRR